MTLLEDLEAAAQVADVNAQACRDQRNLAGVAECMTVAARLRAHAARLREEMTSVIQLKRVEETPTEFARRVLERINGGPLPEPTEDR